MTWETAYEAAGRLESWLRYGNPRPNPVSNEGRKFENDLQLVCTELRAGYEAARPEFDTVSEDDALRGGRWINADDVDRLVKEMDVAINGPNGAEHPKLCDLVNDVKHLAARPTVEGEWVLVPRSELNGVAEWPVPDDAGGYPSDWQVGYDVAAKEAAEFARKWLSASPRPPSAEREALVAEIADALHDAWGFDDDVNRKVIAARKALGHLKDQPHEG